MSMTIKEMNAKAVAELTDVINRIDPVQVDALIERLAKANRVVVYGVGREGLMMKPWPCGCFMWDWMPMSLAT